MGIGEIPQQGFWISKSSACSDQRTDKHFWRFGFGYPKAVLAPTRRQIEQASQKAFVMTKAVLAPTNGRTSIFGDLGFGYTKAVLAPTRRHIRASIQNGFVMTKPMLAPTCRQTFLCRGKRTPTLILPRKTQTRESVFASFRK